MGIGGQDETAFEFTGHWQEFMPIALTNGLLNIVTLSMWRFWGTTREREYLWSRTRFIDDTLEWTGKGLELFLGFLAAIFIFTIPAAALLLLFQGLLLQGQPGIAALLGLMLYLLLLAMTGFAKFRALRYRLSRSEWHGIRGGSHDPGFLYGWETLWRTIASFFTLSLLFPWVMIRLWQKRWNAMSFGSHTFEAGGSWEKILPRYLLTVFVGPIVIIVAVVVVSLIVGSVVGLAASNGTNAGGIYGASAIVGFIVIVLTYAAILSLPIIYYAAFFREAAGNLRLSSLEFDFTARTMDWIKFYLGNIGLYVLAFVAAGLIIAVFGLGGALMASAAIPGQPPTPPSTAVVVGLAIAYLVPFALVTPFINYRNWAFFIRYMEAGGEINIAELTQSTTARGSQGEGLLDALDVGAL